MPNYNSLNHCTWECKYHVVFTPKYRKKTIFGLIRKELKEVFHRLAGQKECKIEEGYLMQDHVHMLISIPLKYSISTIVGFIKGKSSIWVAQNIANKQQNFVGVTVNKNPPVVLMKIPPLIIKIFSYYLALIL
ncbi:MAG: hypothetical protein DMENIID0002_11220 [Rickettsia endosymbiont of Sergentomyia squamirostris]|uniref:Transposase IS200-like domain-containing protein n=1 Tax=Candidatus Tisiphia endosymbiont of Sergentomyia squamirostris TaxID=3113639 RepID=A0AAT9G9U3_9RICK